MAGGLERASDGLVVLPEPRSVAAAAQESAAAAIETRPPPISAAKLPDTYWWICSPASSAVTAKSCRVARNRIRFGGQQAILGHEVRLVVAMPSRTSGIVDRCINGFE